MSSPQKAIKKIKNLEAEKKNLILEIECLKKMADAKATALYTEIVVLRDEVKSMKVLMGQEQPDANQIIIS